MVSDRVAYSLFGFVSNEPGLAGATYPEEYFRDIRPKLVDAGSITLEEVRRFANVAPAEFAASRDRAMQDPPAAYRDPISHLRKILASERSYQAIALDILSRGQPDLFAVYYQGIDEVCHRFAHDMAPKMDMVTPEDFAKYRDTVFSYYRFQDRQLGEVLGLLSPETIVLVLSDHGFQNGSGRPKNDPPNVEGKPGLWHRRYGIFIAAGPGIRPGRLDTISLLDVAPTVLYLAGLPAAADMQGHVLREAIAPAFLAHVPARTLPSYENIGRPLGLGRPGVAPNGMDDEAIAKLRSLGYVGGGLEGAPPGEVAEGGPAAVASAGKGEALVTAHLNEAGVYLKKGDYVRARTAVQEALKMKPDLVAALLLLVNIEEGMKNFDGAGELARQIIAKQPDEDRRIYDELGWIYIHGGRVREGIAYYERLASERPQVPEIRAALGLLLLKDGKREAAEKEFLEALRLNPALPEPLTELHTMYRDTPRILTLEPIVRKGLAINNRSIVHLNLMGIICERKRDLPRAESAFKEALELDPDYAATMANLGALYGRSGRLQDAVAILSRAVGKDPDNVESWMSLGAAQAKLGRTREAIESLETARQKGVRTTVLYNALAIAYLQDHQIDRAVRYLKESLAMDPDQKDASELLKAVSRPS
jgi:tetratricopeptide (TPR) repeat protein